MSNRAARERASRLAEFREADAAYRETGSKEHAKWRLRAMRSKDMRDSDVGRAGQIMTEAVVEQRERNKEILKEANFPGWKKATEEELSNGTS